MRYAICALTVLVCLGATAGIAYLHGYERVLGHEEWRFETRLVRAYANEIPIHAGPLGILALASVLSIRSTRRLRVVLTAAAVVAGFALYETREAERAYILTNPGGLVRSPAWCDTLLGLLWVAAVGVLGGAVYGATRPVRAAPSR